MEEGNVNSDEEQNKVENETNMVDEEDTWNGWSLEERRQLYKSMRRHGKHALHEIAR